ncbi:MAG: hypothetical protein AAF518_07040 [Spirochaetota bacterium]
MKWFVFLAFAIFAFSCNTVEVSHNSKQFAHFDKRKSMYKSISADDVRITVYPELSGTAEVTTSTLWMKEVILQLKTKGYKLLRQKKYKTNSGEVFALSEFAAFYNGQPYTYAVAILPRKKENFISEISGPSAAYKKRKKEILTILKSIQPASFLRAMILFFD